MKILIKFAIPVALIMSVTTYNQQAQAAAKIGASCKKLNSTSTIGDISVKCVKSGKSLIWQKITLPKKTMPKIGAPVILPTGFSDLVANYKGISQAAWNIVNESITANKSKAGPVEIYTGPNTKPYFDEYPKILALVSKLFPNMVEPAKNLVIRYKYEDLAWGEEKIAALLPKDDLNRLTQNENGRLLSSNCRSESCEGSKQVTTSTGLNVILQGVPRSYNPQDLPGKDRFFSGMLEAHEYFHSIQRAPMFNKSLEPKDYPPTWFVEGSAEWVQNAAVNSLNFKKYKEYFRLDCQQACSALSKAQIEQILREATNEKWPDGFDYWLNYALGSMIVENLVAIGGPESIVRLYEVLPTKVGFDGAFKKVYGIDWNEAIPILASAVYSNIQNK